jgi:Ser/Thr protein kinase RdoA (MazF antagonist)
LDAYGLAQAHLTLEQYSANIIFRVDAPGPAPIREAQLYVPDRYSLRVLAINDTDTIASELTWLAALREVDLPVPEPAPTLDGRLYTKGVTPGVPRGRVVSLMRWIDGRHLTTRLRPHHARALGRLVAQLHGFSAAWQPPGRLHPLPLGLGRAVWRERAE